MRRPQALAALAVISLVVTGCEQALAIELAG